MLHRLNKDLLVKLIENINDPNTLNIGEMQNRIKIYTKLIPEKERQERIRVVKNFLWELRKVTSLKNVIENKKEIEELDLDFSEITKAWNEGRWAFSLNKIYKETKIFYKGKFLKLEDLRIKTPFFSIDCGNEQGYVSLWKLLIIYIYNGKWEGEWILSLKNIVKNMDDGAIYYCNDLDWVNWCL